MPDIFMRSRFLRLLHRCNLCNLTALRTNLEKRVNPEQASSYLLTGSHTDISLCPLFAQA
jgi:hypothetical protein